MFFCVDKLNTQASAIAEADKIATLSVKAWAGVPGEPASFRIGNDTETDIVVDLQCTGTVIEISSDKRSWGPSISYANLPAGKVGDTVYVRAIATIDEIETESTAYINVMGYADRLTVNYYLAPVNEVDSDKSQAYKYEGDNTREVRAFFDTDGEAVRLLEYTPLPKPDRCEFESGYLPLDYFSIREWCNPNNQIVGYTSKEYFTKAFVGDRSILSNASYNLQDLNLSYGDASAIILPHDFEGFDPTPFKTLVPIDEYIPGQWQYQSNLFCLIRDNQEYHLKDIKPVRFFKGQILFWYATLEACHYPGGSSTGFYLPWNVLVDQSGKQINVVPEWSTAYAESDPYTPNFAEVIDTSRFNLDVFISPGPQGPTGAQGQPGPTGATGARGAGATGAIMFYVDGAGSPISTGAKAYTMIPYAATITGWTMLADVSGSVTVDVWKSGSSLPTDSDSITNGNEPTMSAQKATGSTGGWLSTSIAANDAIRINVDSVTTITQLLFSLNITRP